MTGLSYPAEFVRRYDHDRFITAIFAPPRAREHLFALYAFNIEIAKTGEIVSESLIGQMRLQWWRDVLERLYTGGDVAHEVARPLGAAIRECGLPEAAFHRLIEAREFDLERQPPPDLAAMLRYAEGDQRAAARAGAENRSAARGGGQRRVRLRAAGRDGLGRDRAAARRAVSCPAAATLSSRGPAVGGECQD